jgi:hypothetical protein
MIDLWPVHQALYTALTEAPATYPTYDAVPQNTAAPYLTIGQPDALSDEEIAVHSADIAWLVHAWSRQNGKKQAYAMLEFVRERLDGQDIGAGVWACTVDAVRVFEDPTSTAASRLFHGIAELRIRAN